MDWIPPDMPHQAVEGLRNHFTRFTEASVKLMDQWTGDFAGHRTCPSRARSTCKTLTDPCPISMMSETVFLCVFNGSRGSRRHHFLLTPGPFALFCTGAICSNHGFFLQACSGAHFPMFLANFAFYQDILFGSQIAPI